jgi:hypothetical protein
MNGVPNALNDQSVEDGISNTRISAMGDPRPVGQDGNRRPAAQDQQRPLQALELCGGRSCGPIGYPASAENGDVVRLGAGPLDGQLSLASHDPPKRRYAQRHPLPSTARSCRRILELRRNARATNRRRSCKIADLSRLSWSVKPQRMAARCQIKPRKTMFI